MTKTMNNTFGNVVDALKYDPRKLAYRKGWHGKNMYIYLEPAKQLTGLREPLLTWVRELYGGDSVNGYAHFNMLVDSGLVSGWLASQMDMVAEDWVICTRVDEYRTLTVRQEIPVDK